MNCYRHIFSKLNGKPLESIQLSFAPNILTVIPSNIASRHIHSSLLHDSFTYNFLCGYWKEVKYAQVKTIFYLDGLDMFMETGICNELPFESQTPFTLSERKIILRIFLEKCDSKQIIPILLREKSIVLTPELSLKTMNKLNTLFIWSPVHNPFSSCSLEESTLKECFSDFLEYIQEISEFTYSPEESLELLHHYVEKYAL